MIQFHHNGDNIIFIDDGKINISLTLKDFQTMEKEYILPAPYIDQIYFPGKYWTRWDGNNAINLPIPWIEGDKYISRVQYYIDNRPIKPPTLEEAKMKKISEVYKIGNNILYSGFFYKEFNLNVKSEPYSSPELISYAHSGNFPLNFKMLDKNDEIITINLKQLMYINSKTAELNYITRLNIGLHNKKINSFTTVKEVQDYNIETGWTDVPWEI